MRGAQAALSPILGAPAMPVPWQALQADIEDRLAVRRLPRRPRPAPRLRPDGRRLDRERAVVLAGDGDLAERLDAFVRV